MAKKKSSSTKNLIFFIGLLCALLSVVLFLILDVFSISIPVLGNRLFTGIEFVFGCKTQYLESELLQFNYVALIAILLPVLGILLSVLSKKNKLIGFVSSLFILGGAVMMFILPSFASIGYSDVLSVLNLKGNLEIGGIIGGSLNIVAFLSVFYAKVI